MADNTVSVRIDGEDDSGAAFAKATAEAKAFSKVVQDSNRAEVKSHIAASEAAGAHSRALDLLKKAGEELDKPGPSGPGLFSRLFSSAGSSLLGALSTGLSAVTSAGAGTAVMFGALGTAIFAAAAALMPLIASLGLVTVGFAGFALLAKGEVSSVFTALSEHGKKLHNTMKSLDPATRALVKSAEPLKDEFHKLQKAIQPEIVKAFAAGIRILKELFPALKPLVEAAGKALDGFLRNIAKWLNGPSGKKFLHWMETEGPKAIAEFGRALWTGMQALGRFLDFMLNVGETMRRNWFRYMHDLSIFTDNFRIGFIQMGHLIEAAWNSTTHGISNATDAVREAFVSAGHVIESIWNAIAGAATKAAGIIVGAISRISGALAGLPGMGVISGALGLVSKLNPFATGGIVGAATGGVRGGFQLVGEQGPELVRLPAGSTVYSAQQTPGMMGAGGQPIVIQFYAGGNPLSQEFFTQLMNGIRVRGGDPRIVTSKVSALA